MKLVCTESGFAVGVQSLFLVFKSVVSHFTPLYFGVCVCCISTTTRIFSAHVIRFKKKNIWLTWLFRRVFIQKSTTTFDGRLLFNSPRILRTLWRENKYKCSCMYLKNKETFRKCINLCILKNCSLMSYKLIHMPYILLWLTLWW